MKNILVSSIVRDLFFNGLPVAANTYLKVLAAINSIMCIILFFMYFHQYFYAVVAVFTRKKQWPKAKAQHKYAYLICAHDEEKVVGNLIDSILAQEYPKELMKVFVCADNCTDKTAQIAKERGAVVFERFSDKRGKSYAMDYMIKRILSEYAEENFEAAFVFDADNLVTANYTEEMNKLYDAGFKAATSFRASKNVSQNWVTAGSSYMFYRECAIVHHSRSKLGIGTYISGTGYYISMDILAAMGGWNCHTMTEDIEFSVDCALKKIKIGFNENAIFYDEQPQKLRDSCRQRLRWCRGTHECFGKYYFKNIKDTVKSGAGLLRFEMSVHISPLPVISTVWSVLYLLLVTIGSFGAKAAPFLQEWYVQKLLPSIGIGALSLYLMLFIFALISVIKCWKLIDMSAVKKIWYCFTFPFFFALYLPLSAIALFKRVRWTKIPHTVAKSIEELSSNK